MNKDKRKALQNLRQDKVIQANLYEEARAAKDQIGMRRARKKIEEINTQIILVKKG